MIRNDSHLVADHDKRITYFSDGTFSLDHPVVSQILPHIASHSVSGPAVYHLHLSIQSYSSDSFVGF